VAIFGNEIVHPDYLGSSSIMTERNGNQVSRLPVKLLFG